MSHATDGMNWVIRGDPRTLFADPKRGPEFLRLMLAMNVLDTLHRVFFATLRDEHEAKYQRSAAQGDQVVLLTIIYGALTEALEAYAALRGTIEALASKVGPDEAANIALLRDACKKDKGDPSTFLNRIVKRIRNNVGFHWRTEAILQGLKSALQSTDEIIMSSSLLPDRTHVARFVFADAVAANVLTDMGSKTDTSAMVTEAARVTTAFLAVVETALAQLMLDAGFRATDA